MSVADCMGGGGVEEAIISMPVPGSRRVGEWEELAESGDYMMPSYSTVGLHHQHRPYHKTL